MWCCLVIYVSRTELVLSEVGTEVGIYKFGIKESGVGVGDGAAIGAIGRYSYVSRLLNKIKILL